ncbi:MAG TPA: HRDC domain-containing protein, partial [Thermoanaerobaculia bacterium]|nr:HRDC domain-containing protein [Thermoanaerobaculia bacterium]
PRLGLVQVGDDRGIALLDAVALDLAPLAPMLRASSVRKVFHAGGADVAVLLEAAGARPSPVLDTQVAAGFAGLGPALSYGALVEALFGIVLGKHETRTDWLRRPLRETQLRYAAEDVEHLLPAARELERRLTSLGRLGWALEDSAAMVERETEPVDPEQAWRRLKGLGRLPPRARRIARELAVWREREAERLDLARPFLLRDETLVALARRESVKPAEVAKLPGFDARRHASRAASWLEALAAARAAVDAGAGADEPRPPSRAEIAARDELADRIGEEVTRLAAGLELPPELLLSRRHRERLVARREPGSPLSAGLTGFRRELIGPAIDPLTPDS